MEISFEEWKKIELKVGKIVEVEDIPNADKLYKLKIDVGEKKLEVVAGIKKYYKKEELKDKLCIVFVNLKPAVIKGIKSEGMILAAVNKEKDEVCLIQPEKQIEIGSNVE
jgi:methionyl-tRNA synthetase